jgi:formate-dependent nitrite reductase cytochrome c552 subunit
MSYFCFALLAMAFFVMDESVMGENNCVDCHKKAETISSLQPWQADSYFSWKSSIHGQKGVTCNKCHGGDPTQVKKNLAHQGVLDASHSNSMIFYKNVPKTCSPCHQKIYEGFAQSKHYQSLKEDKMVPTCTTCHGFHMGIGVANLYELAGKCAVCHNERTKIYPKVPADVDEILAMTKKIDETLVKAEYTLELAREARQEIKPLQDRFKAVGVEWDRVSALWHTFDLELIKREAKATLKEVDQVYAQLKGILMKRK